MTSRSPRPLALVLPGRITDTALTLPPGLSIQKCREIGSVLGRLIDASPWWIADCLIYAEDHHGELYAQVAAETHLAAGTLVNLVRVGRAFPPPRRRGPPLTLAHHADVLGVETPAAQDRWLAQAEKGDWTRAELRRRLRGDTEAKLSRGDDAILRLEKALEIIRATRERVEREQRAWTIPELYDLLNELEMVLGGKERAQ